MQKHYVVFYSPGTLVSETTSYEIDSWDVDKAVAKSKDVKERYNARPYGFRFVTRSRSDDELDSKETASSNMYYLGGTVRTREEVLAGTDPRESILRSNIRDNKDVTKILVNTNSYKFTTGLYDGDVVLDV